MGIPSRFFAGGNIACEQAKRAVSDILTVTTKTELSRNAAIFRDNDELFADIRETIVRAIMTEGEARPLSYPATLEKSFKRVEDAEKYLVRLRDGGITADHPSDEILGKDAHTVVSKINDIGDFIKCL